MTIVSVEEWRGVAPWEKKWKKFLRDRLCRQSAREDGQRTYDSRKCFGRYPPHHHMVFVMKLRLQRVENYMYAKAFQYEARTSEE